jgi:aryl-alcohol dehydrogenase-like predicted oxidoreductase
MNDVLDIFLRLKEQGLIRAIGASIKGPNVTSQTKSLCSQYIQSGKCDVLQVIFSMARQRNRQIFDEAGAAGVGVVARSCLESGFLTGKFSSNKVLSKTDHRRRWQGQSFKALLGRVSTLEKELNSKGLLTEPDLPSMTHLALRYAYEEPHVSAIIPGASSLAQVRSNCSVSELPDLDQKVRRAVQDTFAESTTSFNLQDHATFRSRLKTMLAGVKRKL